MENTVTTDMLNTIIQTEETLREVKHRWRKHGSIPNRHNQLIQESIDLDSDFLKKSLAITSRVIQNIDRQTTDYQSSIRKAGIKRVYMREPAETLMHAACTDHLLSRVLRSQTREIKDHCIGLHDALVSKCPAELWVWLLKTTYEWNVITNWTILDCCAKVESADVSLRTDKYHEYFNLVQISKIDFNSIAVLEPVSQHAKSAAVVKRFTDIVKSSMTSRNVEFTRLIDNITILYTYLQAFLPTHVPIVDRIVAYYNIPESLYQKLQTIHETFPTDLEYKLAFNNARLAYAINYIAGININLESVFQTGRNESLAKLVLTATTFRYFKAIGCWTPAIRILLDKLYCCYFKKNLPSISEYIGKYSKSDKNYGTEHARRESDLKIMRDLGLWKSTNVDIFNAELIVQNQPGNFLPHFTMGKKMLLYHSIRAQIKIISSHIESKGTVLTISLLHCDKEDLLQVCGWIWQLASKEGSRRMAIEILLMKYSSIMDITPVDIESVFLRKETNSNERTETLITYIMNVLTVKSYLVSYNMPELSISKAIQRAKPILGYFYLETFDRIDLKESYFRLIDDASHFKLVVLTETGISEFKKVKASDIEIDLICMLLTIHMYWSYTSDVYKPHVSEREFASTSYTMYNTVSVFSLGYLLWHSESNEMTNLQQTLRDKNNQIRFNTMAHIQYILKSYMNLDYYDAIVEEFSVDKKSAQEVAAEYGLYLDEEEMFVDYTYMLKIATNVTPLKAINPKDKYATNTNNNNAITVSTPYVYVAFAPIVCDEGFFNHFSARKIRIYQYPLLNMSQNTLVLVYVSQSAKERDQIKEWIQKQLKGYTLASIHVENKYQTSPFIMPNYLKNMENYSVNYPEIFAELNYLDQTYIVKMLPPNQVPYPLSQGLRTTIETTSNFIGNITANDYQLLAHEIDIDVLAKHFLSLVNITSDYDIPHYCNYLMNQFIEQYNLTQISVISKTTLDAMGIMRIATKTLPNPSELAIKEFGKLKSSIMAYIMKRETDIS